MLKELARNIGKGVFWLGLLAGAGLIVGTLLYSLYMTYDIIISKVFK